MSQKKCLIYHGHDISCLADQQSMIPFSLKPCSLCIYTSLKLFNFSSLSYLKENKSTDSVPRFIILGGAGKFIGGSDGISNFSAIGKIFSVKCLYKWCELNTSPCEDEVWCTSCQPRPKYQSKFVLLPLWVLPSHFWLVVNCLCHIDSGITFWQVILLPKLDCNNVFLLWGVNFLLDCYFLLS